MPKRKPDTLIEPAKWVDPDDAPDLTTEWFDDAERYQGDKFVKRGRGRPPTGNAKELVSMRLDQDVLAKLRETGPGWSAQVSDLLRAALAARQLHEDASKIHRKAVKVLKRPGQAAF